MLGREPHHALVGIPGLEHDRARVAAPAAAAGELREQRERALLAAEVGPGEALIGVDRRGQAQIAEVVALGHHLRADEHGGRLAREALERRVETALALGRVGVEAQHRDVRQQLGHGLADALGARAEAGELDRAAGRALARGALACSRSGGSAGCLPACSARLTSQRSQRKPCAAAAAVQRRRLAAAVEQEDRAAALVGEPDQPRAQGPRERIEPVPAEIDDLDARQAAADAGRQRRARQPLPSSPGAASRSRRRRRRPRAARAWRPRGGRRSAGRRPACRPSRAPRRRRSARRPAAARRPPSGRRRRRARRRRSPPRAPRGARRRRCPSAARRRGRRSARRIAAPSAARARSRARARARSCRARARSRPRADRPPSCPSPSRRRAGGRPRRPRASSRRARPPRSGRASASRASACARP